MPQALQASHGKHTLARQAFDHAPLPPTRLQRRNRTPLELKHNLHLRPRPLSHHIHNRQYRVRKPQAR